MKVVVKITVVRDSEKGGSNSESGMRAETVKVMVVTVKVAVATKL